MLSLRQFCRAVRFYVDHAARSVVDFKFAHRQASSGTKFMKQKHETCQAVLRRFVTTISLLSEIFLIVTCHRSGTCLPGDVDSHFAPGARVGFKANPGSSRRGWLCIYVQVVVRPISGRGQSLSSRRSPKKSAVRVRSQINYSVRLRGRPR